MKFLLNMNIQPGLGRQLENEGYPSRHVRDIGLAKASDQRIVEEAKNHDEIIITHDLDYGHLLAFSGKSKPSVIIFRVVNNSLRNLFSRIQTSIKQIEAPLLKGAIVVVEDLSIRIRSLPIKADKSE